MAETNPHLECWIPGWLLSHWLVTPLWWLVNKHMDTEQWQSWHPHVMRLLGCMKSRLPVSSILQAVTGGKGVEASWTCSNTTGEALETPVWKYKYRDRKQSLWCPLIVSIPLWMMYPMLISLFHPNLLDNSFFILFNLPPQVTRACHNCRSH